MNCEDNKEAISVITLETKTLCFLFVGIKKKSNEQREEKQVIERERGKIKFFCNPSVSNSCLGDTICFSPPTLGDESFCAYIFSVSTLKTRETYREREGKQTVGGGAFRFGGGERDTWQQGSSSSYD